MIALVVVGVLGGAVFGAAFGGVGHRHSGAGGAGVGPGGGGWQPQRRCCHGPGGGQRAGQRATARAGRGPAPGAGLIDGVLAHDTATEWVRAIAGNCFFAVCRAE